MEIVNPPGWCQDAIPTTEGWTHPNTGKLLNKISKGIPAGDARAKGFEQFIIDRFAKIPGVKLIFEKLKGPFVTPTSIKSFKPLY